MSDSYDPAYRNFYRVVGYMIILLIFSCGVIIGFITALLLK